MTNFDELKKREQNDPMFASLITSLYSLISTLQLSPNEIREASMYAAMKFEMLHSPTAFKWENGNLIPLPKCLCDSLLERSCPRCTPNNEVRK